MSIKEKISAFMTSLKKDHQLMPYTYNIRNREFEAGKDTVYYSGPVWDDAEVVAAIETLLTGKWLASGENVAKFEIAFSRKYGFGASLMVNSGSSANLVMISALKAYFNWKDTDEIIVSTVGFPTTVAPLIQNQLVAKFVDITMDDLNFDLKEVEKAITPNTKAIFISPVLGNAPDMDKLVEISKKHDVMLVLDGCDSLGSKWDGKELSDYAFTTSCSFYPAHHITTGEGGMVSSFNKEFIKLARKFAWWGRDCYCIGSANLLKNGSCNKRFDTWLEGNSAVIDHKYLFSQIGYNLKPLDLQGSIGLVQMEKMDMIHEKRREMKNKIAGMFEKHIPGIKIPQELSKAETSWFGVPVICETAELKTKLVKHLEDKKIQTRNYFAGNILQHPGYKHLDDASKYPNANKVLEQVFFVGCHPTYDQSTLNYIEQSLKEFKA
ncbi:MAG: aminotransferase class V-fold PLP-dependent enzyme [Bdellovibrionota bacterium]